MTESTPPPAIHAARAAPRSTPSRYPEPFASRMAGRIVRPLGDVFGLANFGVNLVALAPGSMSALRHAHRLQDEFVYILSGEPTLVTNRGETRLQPGMCVGFRAGRGDAHQLVNRTDHACEFLVVGDRTPGDTAHYPDDDIVARSLQDGTWIFTKKNGTPY